MGVTTTTTTTTTTEEVTATTATVAAGTTTRPPEEETTTTTTTTPGGNLVVDAAASLYSLYTTNYNHAAGWIEDLEQQHTNEDPHKHIRENLDRYLQGQGQRHSPSAAAAASMSGDGNTGTTTRDGSGGSYEEWILQGFEGWDDEEEEEEDKEQQQQQQQQQHYKEIPAQYYAEECIHRNIWNERVHRDGIRIEDTHPSRSYVPAPSTGRDRRHPATYDVPEETEEATEATTPDEDDITMTKLRADPWESDAEDEDEVVFVTAPEHDADERPAGSLLTTDDTRLFRKAAEVPSRQPRMEETGNNRGGEGLALTTTTTTTGTATSTRTNHDVTADVSTLPDDSDLDILLLDDDTSNEDEDVA